MDVAMIVLLPDPMPENAIVNPIARTYLEEDGTYSFDHVVPGRYRVVPFYGSTLNLYGDPDALRCVQAAG